MRRRYHKQAFAVALIVGCVMLGFQEAAYARYKEVRPENTMEVTQQTFDLLPTAQLRHRYWGGKLQAIEFENHGKPVQVEMEGQKYVVHTDKKVNLMLPQTQYIVLHVEPYTQYNMMGPLFFNDAFKRSFLFEYPLDEQ